MKVKLKRILAGLEVSSWLGEMLQLTETPIGIVDERGNCLFGDYMSPQLARAVIDSKDEPWRRVDRSCGTQHLLLFRFKVDRRF